MTFPSFLNQYTNSPISITFPSYLALNITSATNLTPPPYTSPVQLYWPFQAPYETNQFSQFMQIVTNDSAANILTLPDATVTSIGQSAIIQNISATTLQLWSYGTSGVQVALIGPYDQETIPETYISYYISLVDNSTSQGAWTVIPFGTATTQTDVTALVDTQTNTENTNTSMQGGLAVITDTEVATPGPYLKINTLVQQLNVGTLGAIYNQHQGDRGTLLMVTGDGNLTYNLLPAVTATNGFQFSINNTTPSSGGGEITVIANIASGDTIDGATQFVLGPSSSATFISSGSGGTWSSLGFGITTTPTQFNDVTIELATGSNNLPPLRFFNDTTKVGLYAGNVGTVATTNLQIVQTVSGTPITIAQFEANTTNPTGLVTLASNTTITPTIASLVGSTFSTSNVDIEATGTIDITSTAGNINLTSETNTNINSAAIVSIIASNDVTIMSSTADVDITGDVNITLTAPTTTITSTEVTITGTSTLYLETEAFQLTITPDIVIAADSNGVDITTPSVNMITPSIQQKGISIYSLMRAYS